MYAVMVFPGGRQVDALLLSASPERLRVMIPGRKDTTEIRLIEGLWMLESGERVELGAILAEDAADAGRVWADARPLAIAAG